jgi:hypothetical protein
VLTIVAREYAFDAPDTIDRGPVTIQLVSRGREYHYIRLARIDSGHTRDEYQRSLDAPTTPSWITFAGGVGTVEAGGAAATTLDLTPGLYVMTCDIPDARGTMHMMEGMLRYLVVREHKNGAELPRADAPVTMTDFRFTVPDTLRAGPHILEVKNASPHDHMALLWRITPGRTAADVLHWMRTYTANSASPVTLVGGLGDLSPGRSAQIVATLERGRYMLVCLATDGTPDRTEHFALGMIKEIVVE